MKSVAQRKWQHCNAKLQFTDSLNNSPAEPQAPNIACSFTPTSLLPSVYWTQCHLFLAFKCCVLIKMPIFCLFKIRLILSHFLILDLALGPCPSSSGAETLHVLLISISPLYIPLLWLTSFNLIILIKPSQENKLWDSSLCISFHAPIIFRLLGPDIPLNNTCLLSCEKFRIFWHDRRQ